MAEGRAGMDHTGRSRAGRNGPRRLAVWRRLPEAGVGAPPLRRVWLDWPRHSALHWHPGWPDRAFVSGPLSPKGNNG